MAGAFITFEGIDGWGKSPKPGLIAFASSMRAAGDETHRLVMDIVVAVLNERGFLDKEESAGRTD